MLLAQISDLHVRRPGVLANGRVDTATLLARCIARLNVLTPRPDALLITGDLVDSGEEDEYRHLQMLLASLQMPYHLMVGNHDDRTALRRVFPEYETRQHGGFMQYAIDVGAVRVIALDSLQPGASGGTLCAPRLAWFAAQLEAAQRRPVLVAIHHPPIACGIAHMDRIALDADAARQFGDLLHTHPNVERVMFGHVHRTMFARFGGTLACAAPSPAHQVTFDLRDDGPAAFSMEAPGFLMHRYTPADGCVTHLVHVDPGAGPFPFD